VFGNKKAAVGSSSQDALADRARKAGVPGGFWEGEWVCKDCGYIYNRVSFFHWNECVMSDSRKSRCPTLVLLLPCYCNRTQFSLMFL
jgi:hypothetical protein